MRTDGRTNGQKGMAKLIVALRNFENAATNVNSNLQTWTISGFDMAEDEFRIKGNLAVHDAMWYLKKRPQ